MSTDKKQAILSSSQAAPLPIYMRDDFMLLVFGGSTLSFHAGWINVICLLEFWNQAVAHVTGTISQITIELSQASWGEALFHVGIVLSFMFGSFCSGLFIGNTKFKFKRSYGVMLMVESVVLLCGAAILDYDDHVVWSRGAFLLVALACGIQNGMCTGFSGAVIRTTHFTGITTDIGLVLGHYVRNAFTGKEQTETWKLMIFVPLLLGYFFGGLGGTVCYWLLGHWSLTVPAVSVGLVGMLHCVLRSMWLTAVENLDVNASVSLIPRKLTYGALPYSV
jgi:uncharacterized membrane protein YoaK (UPF0700 family)